MNIADIRIEDRHRKDLGDIESLAKSIDEIGLLHPIVVRTDNLLVCGERRIAACKMLGWLDIPATRIDLEDIARGEHDENVVRKNFTPSEAVAIGKALEPIERAAAKERQGYESFSSGKLPELKGNTLDKVADAVGMSRHTYEKAEAVVDSGVPELITAMDDGDISIDQAAKIAKEDTETQRAIMAIVETEGIKPQEAIQRFKVEGTEQGDYLAETHQLISQSNSNEWYTPQEYVEAARRVMGGIDLDPASNDIAQGWIKATTYYTAETDGLSHNWDARVFLNPPWGRLTGAFIAKLVEEREAGHVQEAIVLVNAHATDTQWFDPLWDGLLCFTNHRINYSSPAEDQAGGSTHGSVFVYFGDHTEAFIQEFGAWGAIVQRVDSI